MSTNCIGFRRNKVTTQDFPPKVFDNCYHWITWSAHMGTSDMPYNYVTKVPLELAVGQFLMNLRKKYRASGLPKCYETFMEKDMHYQLTVYKK